MFDQECIELDMWLLKGKADAPTLNGLARKVLDSGIVIQTGRVYNSSGEERWAFRVLVSTGDGASGPAPLDSLHTPICPLVIVADKVPYMEALLTVLVFVNQTFIDEPVDPGTN